VDPRCAWSTVSTVTHFDCECDAINFAPENELKITRYAGRGAVIVNLKKFKGMGAIGSMFLGNRTDTTDIAGRVEQFWDYAQLHWATTSPKYCILYRYNYPTGTEYIKNYKYYGTSFSAQRVIPMKPQFEEDAFNNLTLKQLPLELL
jgi:hypothetical protein